MINFRNIIFFSKNHFAAKQKWNFLEMGGYSNHHKLLLYRIVKYLSDRNDFVLGQNHLWDGNY